MSATRSGMRIVVAPNAFKETLSAVQATEILTRVFRAELPDSTCRGIPVADGGDGTLDAFLAACGGRRETAQVMGPLGAPVRAGWALLDDGRTGVIEIAEACGLARVPLSARNPMRTTSYGAGELIRRALDAGVTTLVLGIGGSATVDGGLGLLQALGAVCLDARGQELADPLTGADLRSVVRLNLDGLDPRLAKIRMRIACDVEAPLTGARGAAAVFGPQKGATPAMVEVLEAGLKNLGAIFAGIAGRDIAQIAGAGAAGGVGAALIAALHASLEPGTAILFEASGLPGAVAGAELVVTGEGRLDASTLFGKAPARVAELARTHGVPVVAFCGHRVPEAAEALARCFDAVIETASPETPWEIAKAHAASALADAATRFCRVVLPSLPLPRQR